MYHKSESAGGMLDISNAQPTWCQAGSLHTVLGFETHSNPHKLMSKVHLLALNKEIVYQGSSFETIYV
jgi:hypothetical protein